MELFVLLGLISGGFGLVKYVTEDDPPPRKNWARKLKRFK